MTLKLTIMGCGNSAGTPSIGNYWGQCDPAEPRNRRTRPSIAIQSDDKTIIVDTGPDFKAQVNAANISRINAILYSHAHSDHINGIDDLRVLRLRHKTVIPIYLTQETLTRLQTGFEYMFTDIDPEGLYPQVLEPHIIAPGQTLNIEGIKVTTFLQSHGSAGSTLGFRFGNVAYSTDMFSLPDESYEILRGIDTWIVDGAGYNMPLNLVHARLKDVIAYNEIVKAPQVYLTHMPSFMDYQTLLKELPPGYAPAYDGLVLEASA